MSLSPTVSARRTLGVLLVLVLGTSAGTVQELDESLADRRALAAGLADGARPADFERALTLLSDSDPRTRSSMVAYLGAVSLDEEQQREKRVEALAQRARDDTSRTVRRAALAALAELESPGAAGVLFQLVRELSSAERVEAARLFCEKLYPRSIAGRELLDDAVAAAFTESGEELPSDVLAVLLPTYGKRLAERDGGGDLARERAPLVLGLRDPSPSVRRSAQQSLQAFLGRLRELDRHERADRALARFAEDGVTMRPLLYLRVINALEEGGVSPQVALEGARRLGESSPEVDAFEEGHWRARAALLESNALIALDRLAQAKSALRRAADLFDGLIARRIDLSGELGAGRQRDLLHDRALVDFAEVFVRIAGGTAADDLAILQRLRSAHSLQIRSQLVAQGADLSAVATMDPFFSASLSPCRLVFAVRPHGAWPAGRCIRQKRHLGRALASISAREMPGYEPFPDLLPMISDPVLDPRRAQLLEQLSRGKVLALRRQLNELRIKELTQFDANPELQNEIARLSFLLGRGNQELNQKSLAERFYNLRRPSADALQLAELLRREDRTQECREVAERFDAALEAEGLRQMFSWAWHLAAQTQLLIGGSWSDEGDAPRAQEHMQKSLELLEGLRAHFEENNMEGAARAVDDDIADTLVSLAVNANVKAGDPERAREYFERAYLLRQDDFMRIMLACYRARSGLADEARELIRDVPESPRGYYNLACTHALLGEKQRALEFLEADFAENRISAGALEKQKEWARGDPDLASLREDPRFQWLTAPAPAPVPADEDGDSEQK